MRRGNSKESVVVCTLTSLSYLSGAMRKRPSSNCISLFSRRLFSTGSTFLSAFSIPSKMSRRPSKAAFTALCRRKEGKGQGGGEERGREEGERGGRKKRWREKESEGGKDKIES